jgi:hypothetical protein
MDMEDINNVEYDAMEPIPANNDHDPYTKHLVLPIKQIIHQKTPSMTFQTPTKTKKIDYDDILASMNLYVKDGQLHKINKAEGIKIAPFTLLLLYRNLNLHKKRCKNSNKRAVKRCT